MSSLTQTCYTDQAFVAMDGQARQDNQASHPFPRLRLPCSAWRRLGVGAAGNVRADFRQHLASRLPTVGADAEIAQRAMAGARMVLVIVASGHVGGAMADRLAAGGLRVYLARRTFGQTVAELTAQARSQPAQERR